MVCPPGRKKSDCYCELAVVERWPIEEVRLYNNNNNNNNLILILRAFHEMIKRALHDFYL